MGNIQEIPPSVLASWPTPNYVDPVRRTWMPAFSLTWQIFATLLVFGRFYLRLRRLAGPFGYDDAFMLVAWMSSVAFTVCAWILTTSYGVDRHTWDVQISKFAIAAMLAWVLQLLMLVASGATKASILLFYRRLVTGTLDRRWKLAIYLALVFHALYLIGLTLGYFLICRPLEAYWMSYDYVWKAKYQEKYTCASAQGLNPVIGVLSVVSDVYAVVLPFVILHHYKLDVSRSQKIGLHIIFAAGLLVAGAGVGRTYYLIKLGNTYDTSWTGFDLLVWTTIELQLGIICACAPSLRAFFRHYVKASISRISGSSHSRSHGRTDTHASASHTRSQRERRSRPFEEEVDLQALKKSSWTDDLGVGEMGEVLSQPSEPARSYGSSPGSEPSREKELVRWNSTSSQQISLAISKAHGPHSPV